MRVAARTCLEIELKKLIKLWILDFSPVLSSSSTIRLIWEDEDEDGGHAMTRTQFNQAPQELQMDRQRVSAHKQGHCTPGCLHLLQVGTAFP